MKPLKSNGARQLNMGGLDLALGFRLRMLEQSVMRSFARHMEPLDLSPTLYSILVLIEANPGCRQIELSQALSMHQPNLVQRVGVLIDRGLLVRREDASDRRANTLELSAAGRKFMTQVKTAHAAHIAEIRAKVGDERYSGLLRLAEALDD
jgi:DNA-binding MarR family transcriptional regulator